MGLKYSCRIIEVEDLYNICISYILPTPEKPIVQDYKPTQLHCEMTEKVFECFPISLLKT